MQTTATRTRSHCILALALTAGASGLFLSANNLAAKGKPGGGGGGDTGPQYVVIDLGSAEGTGGFRAVALNNLGGVVKQVNGLDELWQLDPSGNIISVTSLSGLEFEPEETWAYDVNDQFQVCGEAEAVVGSDLTSVAVVWLVDAEELIELPLPAPTPGFYSFSSARGISENGLVVGRVFERQPGDTTYYNQQGLVWQIHSTGVAMVSLPDCVEAWDVNSDGVVIGRPPGAPPSVWLLQFDETGVLTGASGPFTLPGLGGTASEAFEISDAGIVAGSAWTASGEHHAVLWSVDAAGQVLGIDDLGLPGSNDTAVAWGTNNSGEAVVSGFQFVVKGSTAYPAYTPYLADTAGTVADLNKLNIDLGALKELEDAYDINDLGWISGSGVTRWSSHAVVVIPVP